VLSPLHGCGSSMSSGRGCPTGSDSYSGALGGVELRPGSPDELRRRVGLGSARPPNRRGGRVAHRIPPDCAPRSAGAYPAGGGAVNALCPAPGPQDPGRIGNPRAMHASPESARESPTPTIRSGTRVLLCRQSSWTRFGRSRPCRLRLRATAP
jgi:hypothetical protein